MAKQWLYYASLILKSSVECFKLTFQQLDLELFIPNNLLIVSVMSRMASHMAARLLATVDNFNQLIAGWNEKLKFANSDHSSGVNFSNVYSLFGCDNSTLRDSVKIAKILQEEHRVILIIGTDLYGLID